MLKRYEKKGNQYVKDISSDSDNELDMLSSQLATLKSFKNT
jgi:hypothetical protein